MRWRLITCKDCVAAQPSKGGSRWLAAFVCAWASMVSLSPSRATTTNYVVQGSVKEVRLGAHQLVISHAEIPHFMPAMTMPFDVKDTSLFTNAAIGDRIAFQLHVTGNSSWIDHIERLTAAEPSVGSPAASEHRSVVPEVDRTRAGRAPSSLRNYRFTNQLGDPVSLADFRGQALALTFFFTRCPIPQYCPRLSRNFEEVQLKMHEIANAPTNWHLVSITFDPAHDTPEVLKAYAESYHYDAAHWSFLTGPPDSITELVQACGVTSRADAGLFNHNFRTLIIDASNHLQMVFPTSGDLSDSIVQELLKGAGTTNLGPHTVVSRAPSGTNPEAMPFASYQRAADKVRDRQVNAPVTAPSSDRSASTPEPEAPLQEPQK